MNNVRDLSPKMVSEMLRRSWFVILLTSLICLFQACTKGEIFDDGSHRGRMIEQKREGVWKGTYFSGEKWFKGEYENNKAVGEWTWWYDGGGIREVSFWRDSLRDGEFESFHENGALKEKGMFFKDMKVGDWEWYYEDGQKEGEGKFVSGKRVGEFTTWHKLADAASEETPIVATRHVWKDTTGTIQAFHSNGSIAYEGAFVKDKQDGIWKFYDEDGNLYSEQIYRNGVKVGGN